MSEIKGQLIGIILVLSLFALISTSLKTVVGNYTTAIEENATTIVSEVQTA